MLKLKNLIENDEVVAEILKKYEFKELDFGFCRSSSNVVYGLDGDGKVYFLRYTTSDERTKEVIQEEVDYILYLREHGIYANKPVMTKDDSYVVQMENYLAVLFEAVSGESLDDIELTPEIVNEWGRQLGRLHQLAGKFSKTLNGQKENRPDYSQKFTWIREILSKEGNKEFIKEADWLEKEFNQLSKTESNYGLCHYDFELDNVFYDEEANQFSIIDFDDSMYHFFSIDYEQVMMNIEEDVPEEKQVWVKEEIQKGYQEFQNIPSEDEGKLAREFVILLGYAKLTYSLSYPPEEMPDWMDEIVEKLENAKKEKSNWLKAVAHV